MLYLYGLDVYRILRIPEKFYPKDPRKRLDCHANRAAQVPSRPGPDGVLVRPRLRPRRRPNPAPSAADPAPAPSPALARACPAPATTRPRQVANRAPPSKRQIAPRSGRLKNNLAPSAPMSARSAIFRIPPRGHGPNCPQPRLDLRTTLPGPISELHRTGYSIGNESMHLSNRMYSAVLQPI